MRVLVLCAMVTAFFLFSALLYPLGKHMERKTKRLRDLFPPAKEFINEELHEPFSQRFVKPLFKKLLAAFSLFSLLRPGENKRLEKLQRQLRMAGFSLSAQDYTVAKSLAQLAMVAIAVFLSIRLPIDGQNRLMVAALGLLLAVLAPNYLLKSKVTSRQKTILNELPSVMDLLVVSMEAGLGMDAAISQLYEKRKTPLMQELIVPIRNVQMGLSRRDALKEMGEASGIAELRTMASSLIQAEQLGVSIKSVLISQADQLRTAHKQRVEAKAMKAPVKMMIPTVAFIFPVMFIILLAPAIMRFMETF
ncbi:putative Type II secretion system F domain protein [uncultured Eubacteriales bacterium]|uniref:Putative Type II secretion system F domain protein n=1 Tax=uncultured Eubacteriales bacterium TaxID=172733 RepID=A0A212JE22_9FIRM|nr:putative Type II secretion system F domain protein [uncultured Eubacteriales bacterium]